MDGHCKDCRHWGDVVSGWDHLYPDWEREEPGRGKPRECALIRMPWKGDPPPVPIAFTEPQDGNWADLCTFADFGCALFAPEEPGEGR